MSVYRSKLNPRRTCQAEPYNHHGQRRYRFVLGDTEYDLDGRTFDEMWDVTGEAEPCVHA